MSTGCTTPRTPRSYAPPRSPRSRRCFATPCVLLSLPIPRGGPGGDAVPRAPLKAVGPLALEALEGDAHEPVAQLGIGHAAVVPELAVDARLGEPGHRVEL